MRNLEWPAVESIKESDSDTVQLLDWKDNPETVLEAVDHLLKAHGLEVVQYETRADDYKFKIEKRQ